MLSIIIIHYGDANKTIRCINSVVDKVKVPYEILVWNNDKGTIKIQGSMFKNLKVLSMNKNLGYGRAINKAVKHAKYEYILILNNDTEILEFKTHTGQHLPHTSYFLLPDCICGAETYDEDGIVNSCYLDLNPFDEFFKNLRIFAIVDNIKRLFKIQDSRFKIQNSRLTWTYNVGGHFLFMKKKLFERVGGFDEKFFLYAEEFDLCRRIRLLGYKVIYNPNFKVIHHKKEVNEKKNDNEKLTTEQLSLTAYKKDIVSIRIDSKLYYIEKHYPTLFLFTILSNLLVSNIYIIILYMWLWGKNSKVQSLKYYYITLLKKSLSLLL